MTDVQTLKSPDGNMEMTFHLTAEGTPQYTLNYGDQKVILFNLSGHGLIDMTAYDNYLAGNLHD